MKHLTHAGITLGILFLAGCGPSVAENGAETNQAPAKREARVRETGESMEKITKTDEEWRAELTDEQYRVLRQKGTERAYTGEFTDYKGEGKFACAGCGTVLFDADTKFDSGCGWPSFFEPADGKVIVEEEDRGHGMIRTEVLCRKCGGHLGHVFQDGPQPTGLRYCINSAALELEDEEDE